jgi:hypothetical protein
MFQVGVVGISNCYDNGSKYRLSAAQDEWIEGCTNAFDLHVAWRRRTVWLRGLDMGRYWVSLHDLEAGG